MIIQAEIGIPIPTKEFPRAKYPFRSMKVKESFFVEIEDQTMEDRTLRSIRSLISKYQKKLTAKFVAKLVEEEGRRGIRCWRTA